MEQHEIDKWNLEQIRKQIGRWLSGPNGANLAAILAAQRGPDAPSERGDMSGPEHDANYWGRRARKRSSGEVIRSASFFGLGKVGARCRTADHITLPPRQKWDHYDKHQASAAAVLGIKVIESEDAPSAVKAVWPGGKYGI